jgi:hypothetical protein
MYGTVRKKVQSSLKRLNLAMGGGEEAVPTVSPWLGLPTPNRELREPVSTEGPQRGLIETGEVEMCSQGFREDDGGAAGGFVRTLASQLELTSARVIVVRGGVQGG